MQLEIQAWSSLAATLASDAEVWLFRVMAEFSCSSVTLLQFLRGGHGAGLGVLGLSTVKCKQWWSVHGVASLCPMYCKVSLFRGPRLLLLYSLYVLCLLKSHDIEVLCLFLLCSLSVLCIVKSHDGEDLSSASFVKY